MARNETYPKRESFKAGLTLSAILILAGLTVGGGLIEVENKVNKWSKRKDISRRAHSLVSKIADKNRNGKTSLEEWETAYNTMNRPFYKNEYNPKPPTNAMIEYLRIHKDSVDQKIRSQIETLTKEYNSIYQTN